MIAANRRGIKGFTLIELMIALVLGLIVMATVISLYGSMLQTAAFQTAVLRVQENGRFAVDMISRSSRMAGYNDPTTAVAPASPSIGGSDGPSGALLTVTNLNSSADTFGVHYEGGTDIKDCQGTAVSAGNWVTNLYAITSDDNLVCAVRNNADGVTQAATTLAEGVEDMQILYGVDLDGDAVANRYVSAGSVTDWSQVVNIQVALLVNSMSNVNMGGQSICIGCSMFGAVNDYMLRAEFLTTINFRN